MSSAKFEFGLLISNGQHVDVSGCVFVQGHRFEKDVFLVGLGLIDVDQFEEILTFLEYIWVALLANLTFEFLPVVRGNVFAVFLLLTLCFDPALEAFKVNESDRASAFTGEDKRILWCFMTVPTESALDLIFFSKRVNTERGSKEFGNEIRR